MKTREIVCIHYVNEGTCDLGKNVLFMAIAKLVKHIKRNLVLSLIELIHENKRMKDFIENQVVIIKM